MATEEIYHCEPCSRSFVLHHPENSLVPRETAACHTCGIFLEVELPVPDGSSNAGYVTGDIHCPLCCGPTHPLLWISGPGGQSPACPRCEKPLDRIASFLEPME